MSRDRVAMTKRAHHKHANCREKPRGETAFQQQIACLSLVSSASVVMTGAFQQPARGSGDEACGGGPHFTAPHRGRKQ